MARKTGSLFSSGGGWEVGAVRLGYQPSWGVEYEAARAALWNQTFNASGRNLGCMVGDVRDPTIVNRTTPVDILFTSPVCRDFSTSRSRVKASNVDACRPMLGLATLDYVDHLSYQPPPVIMLENVVAYAKAEPYLKLRDGLVERGYLFDEKKLNAADYGNPSSRPRLFGVFLHRDAAVDFYWPDRTSHVSWNDALARYLPYLRTATATPALKRTLDAWERTGRRVHYPMLFVSQKQGVLDGTPDYFVSAGKPAPTLIVGHSAITGWRVLLGPDDIRGMSGVGAAVLNGFLVPGQFPQSYGAGFAESVVAAIAGDAVSPIMSEALIRGVRWE